MGDALGDATLVAIFGFLGGLGLGLAARLGRFCTLGAIEDALYGGSDIRLRMWAIAIGTAVIGSFALAAAGLFDPETSFYLNRGWNPVAHILGGLLFGYGMALAGNCGYGVLARVGGGDLRAFVIVLVMAIAAYSVISGPFAALRVTIFPDNLWATDAPAGFAHLLAGATGLSPIPVGIAFGALILAAALAPARMRHARKAVFWAVVVGLAITAGWAGTAWVADRSFGAVPVESHTFSAPLGDTVLFTMLASGMKVSFGVGSVVGVLCGACIGSLRRGHFRWEACEDPRELRRQIGGGVLMGFGGAIAVGCSVGQGLSAFSLLAFSAPLTLGAIVIGAWLGLRQLIGGFATL
ncbi:YeeE/YedE family protein [Tropicimonas sp. IMCC6043]|uniref:YeeE/YedE family protein n=1 Tax=Tropicimonas sp. IMCC6043 TaxID=2510645 RepID=UPI00101DC588|nr:YeeE/YedE family protein [Tropicimonas sp. IMCC6043]RYH10590.1 YeeE/YedE family protein [Tropicimonas sp. IMCC6043]